MACLKITRDRAGWSPTAVKSQCTFSRESLKGAWSRGRSCRQGDKLLLKDHKATTEQIMVPEMHCLQQRLGARVLGRVQ